MKWKLNKEWSIANIITVVMLSCSLFVGIGIAKSKIEKIDKKVDKEVYEQRVSTIEKDVRDINKKLEKVATKDDLSTAVDLILDGMKLND